MSAPMHQIGASLFIKRCRLENAHHVGALRINFDREELREALKMICNKMKLIVMLTGLLCAPKQNPCSAKK